MEMQSILLVEDDLDLAQGLELNLEMSGFAVDFVCSLSEAESRVANWSWSLVLLDVNLPDGEGFAFAKEVHERYDIPVIFLTARDLDEDMIQGFGVGADDYITKPFNVKILIQRIHAVLRRYQKDEPDNRMKVGNLEIDPESYLVWKSGEPLTLTRTEFKLLLKFCQNPGRVLTRKILLEELWDQEGNFVDEHTLTIFVSRLRAKILDSQYSYIKTVYGTGYRWTGEARE